MRTLLLTVFAAVAAVSLAVQAAAQDAAEVMTAVRAHYAAANALDMAAVADHHTADFDVFTGGGLLWTYETREEQQAAFQAYVEAGWQADVRIRHLGVEVYGDVAVASSYLTGRWGLPPRQGTWRVTEVWVKEGSEWKEAHHHDSPLVPGPPQ